MIGPIEPRALGVTRLKLVAVPATASFTINASGLSELLFSALAIALLSVFCTKRADLRGTAPRTATACNAGSPWIWRTTSRIFCADIRTLRVIAWTSIKLLLGFCFGRMRAVLLERARQGELAQLVADHIFRHEHRLKNLAVMHVESVTDKFRSNGRAARPGLDR